MLFTDTVELNKPSSFTVRFACSQKSDCSMKKLS